MSNDPTFSYQQTAAQGASPIGQIILLFDTILRDFGRALMAVKAGDVPTRVRELNHALAVIAYLQSVLDYDRGAEAAKRFERFYVVTRGLVLQANAKAMPEAMENLINLYAGVRQAWHQAERLAAQLPAVIPQPEKPLEMRTISAVDDDAEVPQLHWSV